MIGAVIVGLARFLVGGRPEWLGSAPSGVSRIYFANHGSHLDTVLMWAAIPEHYRPQTHPVAAADYWGRNWLTRAIALRLLGSVLVERRGNTPPGTDVLAPLENVLGKGESLIIFPEGTRGTDQLPGPFKSGLFRLAERFPEVELIPVYLANLSRAFPRGAFLPVPISCHVRFGPPLPRQINETKEEFLERARAAVIALAETA